MSDARPSSKEYSVGFRRPPKATQFQPGKSGNPRGRPKGSRSVGATIQSILSQKVVVTEQGRTRRVSRLEVMIRQLANDAMRSDARAMKLLIYLADRYADPGENAMPSDEIAAQDRAILTAFLDEARSSDVHPIENPKIGDVANGEDI